MSGQYYFRDVALIFDVPEHAIRHWVRKGLVRPEGTAHCRGRFSWDNLVRMYNEGMGCASADVDDLGIVVRFYPKIEGFRRLVSIDPNVCFGAPVIGGTRIPTEILAGRFKAGDSVSELLCDYALTREQIRAALRYEGIEAE